MRAPEGTPATGWGALKRSRPRTVALAVVFALGLSAANIALAARVWRYRAEVARLRTDMSDAERRRMDLVMSTERHRVRVTLELIRRQARGDRELHIAVDVDSGRMYLEREGVILRAMQVAVGPARVVGTAPDTIRIAPPRGARTVQAVLADKDAWGVPEWVFPDRGLAAPDDRRIRGALGALGVLLSGGTVIYARPSLGPLADSAYVLPGAILLDAKDARAIAPNIVPGMTVYLY